MDTYGHIKKGKPNYWKSFNDIKAETTAHLFEALGSNGARQKVMQEVFPSAWESFNKFIRRL